MCHTYPLKSGVDHGRQLTYLSYNFLYSPNTRKNHAMKLWYVIILKRIGSFLVGGIFLKKHIQADYPAVSDIILAIQSF